MKIESYDKATAWVTTLNCISGLRNFQDVRKSKFRFISSWIYDFALMIFTCIVATIHNINNLRDMSLNMERIIYTILACVQIVGYAIITCVSLYHSKELLVLRKEMRKVDVRLKKLGVDIKYRSVFCHTSIMTMFLLLEIATIYQLTYYTLDENIFIILAKIFSNIHRVNTGVIIVLDFEIYVYWLGLRFKETNELLSAFLLESYHLRMKDPNKDRKIKSTDHFYNGFQCDQLLSNRSIRNSRIQPVNDHADLNQESQSTNRAYLLHHIRLVHLKLCGISKMLNHIFDTELVLHAFITLVYITIVFYYVYMEIRRQIFIIAVIMVKYIFMHVISNAVKLAFVCNSCEHTTAKANEAIGIIHKFPVCEIDADLKDEMLQFSLQMANTQLGKSKFISFRLNYAFIRQCLSFVSTYLIIAIQSSQNIYTASLGMVANQTYFQEPQVSTPTSTTE